MERAHRILFQTILLLFVFVSNVCASIRDDGSFCIDSDTITDSGAILNFPSIHISDSISLENRGAIYAPIFIDSGNQLNLKNNGKIYSDINIGENSTLVQVINTNSDISRLNIADNAGRFVIVAGGDNSAILSLSDILRAGDFASRIILDNAIISLDKTHIPQSTELIELRGEIMIDVSDIDLYDGMQLLSGVTGDGTISIRGNNIGNLYYSKAIRNGDEIVLSIPRETDYEKVFDNDARGETLNNIRLSGISPKLLDAMDNARSESELNQIMNASIMFHPINMMQPLKLLAQFQSTEQMNQSAGFGTGEIFTIFGNGLNLYLGGFEIDFDVSDFSFGISAHTGAFSEIGKFEDFSGKIYGGAVFAAVKYNWIKMSMRLGADFAEFASLMQNPNGFAIHGGTEIFARVYDDGNFYVGPMVHARFFTANVLNDSDSEFRAGAGGQIGRHESVIGVTTDFSAYGLADGESTQFGIRADIVSIADGAGVTLDAAALQIATETFYKFRAGIKIMF